MDCDGGWTPYGYNHEEPLLHHVKMVRAGLADIGYFEVNFGGAAEARYAGHVLRGFDIKTESGTTFKMHLTRTLSEQEVRHRASRPPPRVTEENRSGEVAGTRGEANIRITSDGMLQGTRKPCVRATVTTAQRNENISGDTWAVVEIEPTSSNGEGNKGNG